MKAQLEYLFAHKSVRVVSDNPARVFLKLLESSEGEAQHSTLDVHYRRSHDCREH